MKESLDQHCRTKAAAFDRLTAGGTKLRQREIEHTAQGRMGGAGNALEWSGKNFAVG